MKNYKTKSYNIDECIPLTTSSANQLKQDLIKEQRNICPLCNQELDRPCLDHQHLTSKENIGENGNALIRGVLCSNCNAFLGKIENNSLRFGIKDLITFLENAPKYLLKDNLPYIHPKETKRLKRILMKSEYNKMIKKVSEVKNIDVSILTNRYKYKKFYNKTLEKLEALYLSIER